LEREVEVFEGFDDGESRTTQPLLQALVVAAVQFVVDEMFEELEVTELVFNPDSPDRLAYSLFNGGGFAILHMRNRAPDVRLD
jgi:hypothetical protein